jgi:hypothetical protein
MTSAYEQTLTAKTSEHRRRAESSRRAIMGSAVLLGIYGLCAGAGVSALGSWFAFSGAALPDVPARYPALVTGIIALVIGVGGFVFVLRRLRRRLDSWLR